VGISREIRSPIVDSACAEPRPVSRRTDLRLGNRPVTAGVRGGMPKLTLPLAALSLALVAGACSSSGASMPPSASGPPPSPTQSGIDHPTGADDIVLQMEEGGGFVPIDFAASQAPTFTLYGDGRVVFQQLVDQFPQPDEHGVTRPVPWRTAQLDAGQIEELLTFALGPGGLGTARESYVDNGIADAPNTIFTINGGGLKKTVVINALGMEPTGGADDAARASFRKLADRLRDFDERGTISTDVYVPGAYRGVLIEREVDPTIPGPTAADWPWPDLTIADFKEGDGTNGPAFPHKSLTAEEIAALDVGDAFGGAQGVIVKAPTGKTYSVILRPLLPDESE
jgi:hypothetical protein